MSVLDPDKFKEEHKGEQWLLMDGSDCTGTEYESLTGNTTVPDSGGCFFSGAKDVSGTIREHATSASSLSLEFDSAQVTYAHSHYHHWVVEDSIGSDKNAYVTESNPQGDSSTASTIKGVGTTPTAGITSTTNIDYYFPNEHLEKEQNYDISSDAETAPINSSLYFYIKVGG